MADYTLVVGTHDPHRLQAGGDEAAIREAATLVTTRYAGELASNPQEVATLIGPGGLVTRPSERIDEFVARVAGPGATGEAVQPGDSNTPDCNGD